MNEHTLNNCKKLIENRDRVKKAFPQENGLMHLCCAAIYSAAGLEADEDKLSVCKEMIKNRFGVFSDFRSSVLPAVAAAAASSDNAEQTLDNGVKVYNLLKKEFRSSLYLPVAAMIIAKTADESRYEEIAVRTRTIYNMMKSNHPFLTSGEDSTFCALMALSEKTDDELINSSEECYRLLKPDFFYADAVLSLSNVLSLCDGTADDKCSRTMDLFKILRESGRKYGTEYELPSLGVLAMSGADLNGIAADMIEIEDWLSEQKDFGFLGSVSKKQRLMYAGILAQRDYVNRDILQTAAVGSALSIIIAQDAAICAAVASSAAVIAAGSVSSS